MMSISDRAEKLLRDMEEVGGHIDPLKRANFSLLIVGLIGEERIGAAHEAAVVLFKGLTGDLNRDNDEGH